MRLRVGSWGLMILVTTACGPKGSSDSKDTATPAPEAAPEETPAPADPATDKGPPSLGDESYTVEKLAEVSLTATDKSAEFPKLVFNGTNYSMLWSADGGRHLMFQKVGLDGKLIGSAVEIYASGSDPYAVVTEARFSWAMNDAHKYLVAFQSNSAHYGIVDDTGNVVVPFTTLATPVTSGGFPSVASDGTDFVVAYASNKAASSPSYIITNKVAADGTPSPDVKVSTGDYNFNPSITWNDAKSLYGIVWQKADSASVPSEVFFASVDASGTTVTAMVRVTADDKADSKEPVITAMADHFGILYRDFREVKLGDEKPIKGVPHVRLSYTDIKGVMVDVTGDSKVDADDEYMISSPYEEEVAHPTFVSQGSEWGITWAAQTAPRVIYYSQAKIVSGKLTHASKSVISAAEITGQSPQIASAKDGDFFVVWMDERGDKAYQIYGAN